MRRRSAPAARWSRRTIRISPPNGGRRISIGASSSPAICYFELPWGPNRRWLTNGGVVAAIVGEWSAQFTLTLQSGTPLTARVLGAATDLLRGVNGSLRADYDGGPIPLADPTVDEFFDVTAFSQPAPGQFGDAARNSIVGPGSRQLNALFQRDIRLGDTRSLTLQVNALNLLDTVQWAAVDTNVNSSTFGQVISAQADADDDDHGAGEVLIVRRRLALVVVCGLAASAALAARQPAAPQAPPRFRSSVDLVLVDVIVRDRNGAPVRDLKADDFELFEDGVRQQILSFAREEIDVDAPQPVPTASTLTALAAQPRTATASAPAPAAPAAETPAHPLTSEEVAGHRLLVLVFDTSSMQPEDVQSAIDSAAKWVDTDMSPADLVAVAAINSSLQVLTDFTSSKARMHAVLSPVRGDRRHGVLVGRLEHGARPTKPASRPRATRRRSTSARRSSTRSTTTCACAR